MAIPLIGPKLWGAELDQESLDNAIRAQQQAQVQQGINSVAGAMQQWRNNQIANSVLNQQALKSGPDWLSSATGGQESLGGNVPSGALPVQPQTGGTAALQASGLMGQPQRQPRGPLGANMTLPPASSGGLLASADDDGSDGTDTPDDGSETDSDSDADPSGGGGASGSFAP